MTKVGVICDRELLKPMDQRVWKEAISLKNIGYEVEIITPHVETLTKEMEDIKIHCIKKSKIPGVTALKIIHHALKGNYSIFHCHEFNPLLYSIILKIVTANKIIWDCHEDYPSLISTKIDANGRVKENKALKQIINLLINLGIRNTNTIITITPPLVKKYRKYKKTVILPNFPPSKLFNSKLKDSNVSRLYNNKKIVIYQGGIKKGRGMGLILSSLDIVLEKIPNLVFVVLGGEIEKTGWSKGIKEFLTNHKENIISTGWIDYDKMAPYLALADLGIIMNKPTHYNNKIGLPNKLFEYMACGLPIISSNLPEIRKIIMKNQCGMIVDSSDPRIVADSIIQFFSDSSKENKYKENSSKCATKYSWDICEKILNHIYKS